MTIAQLFKRSLARWWKANPGNLGAALSFYVFFSLTPILSLGLIIFSNILPQAVLEDNIISTSYSLAGDSFAATIQEFLQNTHGTKQNIIAGTFAILIFLFGSLGVFNQLQLSLHNLWDIKHQEGLRAFIIRRTYAFLSFLALGVVLIISIGASLSISMFLNVVTSYLTFTKLLLLVPVGQVVTFVAIILVTGLIYRFMGSKHIRPLARWLGSLGTAIFFMIGEYILRMYLSSYSFSSSYGALGTLAVLLIWVYYSSQIFFFGAAWTYVLDKGLKHDNS